MSKLFAVLGDIHSNLEALEAVLADCHAEGVTDFICTGDVVGYNANPHECLDIVRALQCPVVMGNHDDYVSANKDLVDFNPIAAAVIEWTRRQLTDGEKTYLRSLPYVSTKMGITAVHSTLDKPELFGYVFDTWKAEANFVHQVTPICFHGHTHCPVIYEKQISGVYEIEAPEDQPLKLPIGRKYFVNVGSVGQPRDGNPLAAYVLYNPATREVRLRRIPYDIATAQAKIRAAGLPERLALRLEVGQ